MLILCCMLSAHAATFTSSDDQITLELPPGWTSAMKPAEGAVLSIVKGKARIDIKKVPECTDQACLEKKIQADLASVKSKQMQVVGNSYTGEEIMRMDFSTAEPLFYISFFTPKNDFSAGYFMLNNQPYSILIKDLTYAQAELIFSFISPANKANQPAPSTPAMEIDLNSDRAYTIDSVPEVQEESLELSTSMQTIPVPAPQEQVQTRQDKTPSLIAPYMPYYVRKLGYGLDILFAFLAAYFILFVVVYLLRLCIKPRRIQFKAPPTSPYPLYFRRRYGTPSLIFNVKDNQGRAWISLTGRWDSFFLFSGMGLVLLSVVTLALTGLADRFQFLSVSSHCLISIYSAATLTLPLGFIIFLCGVLWSQFVPKQFYIYDNKGQRVVDVMQRGWSLRAEFYSVHFLKTGETLILKRRCFSLLRDWTLSDKQDTPLVHIVEVGRLRALLRKFTGHLWGFLRANYVVYLPDGNKGLIQNEHGRFNRFAVNIEKAEMLEARHLLVAALIVNIRDRDKWYPWL